jgi:hypothetical protein
MTLQKFAAIRPIFAAAETFPAHASFPVCNNTSGDTMRDFNFKDANTSAADIAGVRPISEEFPETVRREEIIAEEGPALSSFHHPIDEDESNNSAKIAGAVLVGLLIVGGGIYAYESTLKNTTSPQVVAMKSSPAPAHVAAVTPAPAAPTPDASAAPQPDVTPAATATPSVPAHRTVRTARDNNTDTSVATSTADASASQPVVSQPLAVTPDAAAPVLQPAPSQTAQIQQPITAPVGQPAVSPQPEVANNGSAGVTLPVESAASAPAASAAPAPSDAAPVQPAPAAPADQSAAPAPAP